MQLQLKPISTAGIAEALSKVELYRYLNQAEEAESICLDILAADPENQVGLRQLGLSITDQFTGEPSDRYSEAESVFERLSDPYERLYYAGLLRERRAKAQLRIGVPVDALVAQFEDALRIYDEAEKIRPADNDDAILRWNRCVRILETLPSSRSETEVLEFEPMDSAPVSEMSKLTGTR